ncbi:MAG: regulatory iron-sulfur-containing complex subunit RicT [Phycisphaerae bacterium]
MAALPQYRSPSSDDDAGCSGGSCGTSCGAGLEKIYPTTAVRFGAMNNIGEFEYQPGAVFKCGAKVVIRTERGVELGQQVSLTCNGCEKSVSREQIKRYVETSGPEFFRPGSGRVLREATTRDLDEQARLDRERRQDCDHAGLLAAQLQLDMKIVTAERLLSGDRIIFYFRSEERVDFRQLVKLLSQHHQARIELRQVGARDEARLVADYEICGRECCCKNFLKKLRPVSMKMAKVQKSTLDPSKVSGRCGRLRCCLRYEHEGYEALMSKLPRVGAQVRSSYGVVTVVDRQILTQLVVVRTSDEREVTIPLEELTPLDSEAPLAFGPDAPPDRESGEDDGFARDERGPRDPARARGAGAPRDSESTRDAQPRRDSPPRREQTSPRDRDRAGPRQPRPAETGEPRPAEHEPVSPTPDPSAAPIQPPETGSPESRAGQPEDGPPSQNLSRPAGDQRRRRRRRRRRGGGGNEGGGGTGDGGAGDGPDSGAGSGPAISAPPSV